MTPHASQSSSGRLTAEWERVELLGQALAATRRGRPAPADLLKRLRKLQGQVETDRRQGRGLCGLIDSPLNALELDVLACALAPEAEPRLGWLFQTLQPGTPQPYPSTALLQELLARAPRSPVISMPPWTSPPRCANSAWSMSKGTNRFSPCARPVG